MFDDKENMIKLLLGCAAGVVLVVGTILTSSPTSKKPEEETKPETVEVSDDSSQTATEASGTSSGTAVSDNSETEQKTEEKSSASSASASTSDAEKDENYVQGGTGAFPSQVTVDDSTLNGSTTPFTMQTNSGAEAINAVLKESPIYDTSSSVDWTWSPDDLTKYRDKDEKFENLYHYNGACRFSKDAVVRDVSYAKGDTTPLDAYITIKDGTATIHYMKTGQYIMIDDGFFTEDMQHITWGW